MRKTYAFVTCVQTAILQEPPSLPASINIVARASQIPEEAIPKDVGQAALEFYMYAKSALEPAGFGLSSPAPDWYVEWLAQQKEFLDW